MSAAPSKSDKNCRQAGRKVLAVNCRRGRAAKKGNGACHAPVQVLAAARAELCHEGPEGLVRRARLAHAMLDRILQALVQLLHPPHPHEVRPEPLQLRHLVHAVAHQPADGPELVAAALKLAREVGVLLLDVVDAGLESKPFVEQQLLDGVVVPVARERRQLPHQRLLQREHGLCGLPRQRQR